MMQHRVAVQGRKPFVPTVPIIRPEQKSTLDRALGDTNGPNAGNVRAVISIFLTVAIVVFLFFVTYLYAVNGVTQLHDIMIGGWGLIGGAFTSYTGMYLGARTVQNS